MLFDRLDDPQLCAVIRGRLVDLWTADTSSLAYVLFIWHATGLTNISVSKVVADGDLSAGKPKAEQSSRRPVGSGYGDGICIVKTSVTGCGWN